MFSFSPVRATSDNCELLESKAPGEIGILHTRVRKIKIPVLIKIRDSGVRRCRHRRRVLCSVDQEMPLKSDKTLGKHTRTKLRW